MFHYYLILDTCIKNSRQYYHYIKLYNPCKRLGNEVAGELEISYEFAMDSEDIPYPLQLLQAILTSKDNQIRWVCVAMRRSFFFLLHGN